MSHPKWLVYNNTGRAAVSIPASGREAFATQDIRFDDSACLTLLSVWPSGFLPGQAAVVVDTLWSRQRSRVRHQPYRSAFWQGLDLSSLLELPKDGEEPWDRSVDMAHHSVDWREVSKQVRFEIVG